MYPSNLGTIFKILSIWKKVYFRPFLRVFLCFSCKYGAFWVFFVKIRHVYGPKNITSAWNYILKISSQILFDLKTSNPVLNSLQYIYSNHDLIKTICMFLRYNKVNSNQTKNLLNSIAAPKTSKNNLFFRFEKGSTLIPGYRFEIFQILVERWPKLPYQH